MASQWASFPRQNCAPSVAARGGVILLRGGIDVPRERSSAVVPREKFQELPVLGIPGMSESAFDGWAIEGRRQRAHDHRVGRGQRRPRGDDIRYAAVVDDLSAANVLSRIAASRHLSEHASGHHAWLPPPPAPSLIWTGAGRRDMGRVQ
jgi:hypothetical protein